MRINLSMSSLYVSRVECLESDIRNILLVTCWYKANVTHARIYCTRKDIDLVLKEANIGV